MSLATSANGRLCCRSGLLPIRLAWRAFRTPMCRRRGPWHHPAHADNTASRTRSRWASLQDIRRGTTASGVCNHPRCPGAQVRYRRGLYVLAQSQARSIGERASRRAADQASRRVSESANVPPIFVTCRKHRETADFALVGLSVGRGIYQQHTKKKDQIEHRKHEQATSRLPLLVLAPTYLA